MLKSAYKIFVTFLIIGKCNSTSENVDWCETINQKTMDYIYNFQMFEDTLYLDSALVFTDSALNNCESEKFNLTLTFRKLDILTKKQDYSGAISFVKSIDKPLISDLPYYNEYLVNRYKAMKNQSEGDMIARNSLIRTNINELQQFITKNRKKIDSLYHSESFDEILQNSLHFPPVQYYYNKSIIYGNDSIKAELDLLKMEKNINQKYVNFINNVLENDFLNFIGY
jgi:hypothetical protein